MPPIVLQFMRFCFMYCLYYISQFSAYCVCVVVYLYLKKGVALLQKASTKLFLMY